MLESVNNRLAPTSRRSNMALNRGIPFFLLAFLMVVKVTCQSQNTHPCDRVCIEGEPPKTCRYIFHVEAYHSLSKACYDCPRNVSDCSRPHCVPAGGVQRSVVVINRQLPGPAIHVCVGDRLIVDVHNDMPEQSTSIHWHGLLQRSSPYMDGVPQVTQCPIPPLAAFRYNFTAETPGTHMWHSHSGCQRADGAVGVLTVRLPEPVDPHKSLFDVDLREHSLLLMDWTLRSANDKFAHHFHAGGDNKADTILINGKGRFGRSLSREGDPDVPMPLEKFVVQPDVRYRFRLINAGYLNCPIELAVDNHTLLIIASDGGDLEPVRADVLVSYAGERWDFIIDTNQEIDAYRIRVRGILDCAPKRAYQEAILLYEGASESDLLPDDKLSYDWVRGGMHVNPLNQPAGSQNSLTAAELRQLQRGVSRLRKDPALKPIPDKQLILAYDFFDVNNPTFNLGGLYGINEVLAPQHRTYTPQLNHISMQLPPFPVLPQRNDIKPNSFCNESTLAAQGRDCEQEFCACPHVINVLLGSVVEIILIDEGDRFDANHPFHLHGHAFRVVSIDRFGRSVKVDTIRRLDRAGLLRRNLVDPPVKDTVSVPDGGYAAIRVHFDNPGYWLFHCHIDFHVELGMALIFKVGEHSDMPPVPVGFPQCGSWFGGDSEDDAQHTPEDALPSQEKSPKINKENNHLSEYDDDLEVSVDSATITTQTNVDSNIASVGASVAEVRRTVTENGPSVNGDRLTVAEVKPTVAEVVPTVEVFPTVAEVAPGISEVETTAEVDDDAVTGLPPTIQEAGLNVPEVSTTAVKESTNPTVSDVIVTTFVAFGNNHPERTTVPVSPDHSLKNLKNLYQTYASAGLKSKKDKLSHNEVNKELSGMIELSSTENPRNGESQSSIMRVPPKLRFAVTRDKERVASETVARQGLSMIEPILEPLNSDSLAIAEHHVHSNAVSMNGSSVTTLVLLSLFLLVL